jgi:hypothetical protein
MKLTTYTDENGKVWKTCEIRPAAEPELLAPAPKFEYYSMNDVEKYRGLWAHYADSYNQFIVYYCVKVEDYNEFIDAYMQESEF